MGLCPVCEVPQADLPAMAAHFVERAEASDGNHVMWLNRHVTKLRVSAADLEPLLAAVLAGGNTTGDRVNR
jgi:hypothetical protein